MRVNLMVGGSVELIPQQTVQSRQDEIWLGVDHGATWLIKHGIIPRAAVGDFDSTTSTELATVKEAIADIKQLPTAKDMTDTQAGVQMAINEYQPDEIDIFGATGGRLDQLLANLYLPLQERFIDYLPKIQLIDRQNLVTYYLPGKYTLRCLPQFPYLAFVNLTPVEDLDLVDEKYPLHDWSSAIPFSWSSNEFSAAENHFSFKKGVVAVIRSADWPLQQCH